MEALTKYHSIQVDLTFSPEALRAISKQAMEKKTGARGLRAIMVGSIVYIS